MNLDQEVFELRKDVLVYSLAAVAIGLVIIFEVLRITAPCSHLGSEWVLRAEGGESFCRNLSTGEEK